MSTKCPACGQRNFQVEIRQMADVTFKEDGDHEVTDGPYGDLEFDGASFVSCTACSWSGRLIEADDTDAGVQP